MLHSSTHSSVKYQDKQFAFPYQYMCDIETRKSHLFWWHAILELALFECWLQMIIWIARNAKINLFAISEIFSGFQSEQNSACKRIFLISKMNSWTLSTSDFILNSSRHCTRIIKRKSRSLLAAVWGIIFRAYVVKQPSPLSSVIFFFDTRGLVPILREFVVLYIGF